MPVAKRKSAIEVSLLFLSPSFVERASTASKSFTQVTDIGFGTEKRYGVLFVVGAQVIVHGRIVKQGRVVAAVYRTGVYRLEGVSVAMEPFAVYFAIVRIGNEGRRRRPNRTIRRCRFRRRFRIRRFSGIYWPASCSRCRSVFRIRDPPRRYRRRPYRIDTRYFHRPRRRVPRHA